MKTYTFFEDSGHGWLKVAKKELRELGIESEVSGYSYATKNFAYLEEDCDMTLFVKAFEAKTGTKWDSNVNMTVKYTDGQSGVRRMRSYEGAL